MSDAINVIIGVVLGGGISIAKDFAAHWAGRRRAARYAAVRIICVLTEYIEKCVEVVGDDGTSQGQPAGRTDGGEEYYDPQVSCPAPPIFPDDIDWTSIKVDLMYRLLALPNLARETNRYIFAQSEHSFPPDYEEIFEARWEGYANLGIEALSLADEVRTEFKLPKISIKMGNSDWDTGAFLRAKTNEIQKRQQINQAARLACIAEMESNAGCKQ